MLVHPNKTRLQKKHPTEGYCLAFGLESFRHQPDNPELEPDTMGITLHKGFKAMRS